MAVIQQLRSDGAQQVPPFGSEGVRMAVAAGSAISAALRNELDAEPFTALLALEALRAIDRHAVEPRRGARIYARALAESALFNSWGSPRWLSDTANAFAALGTPAVESLLPLLADRRPAPLGGSRNATESSLDQVRVRDYAWMLICAATRRGCAWDRDPAVRDVAIDALARELGGRP